MKKRRKDLKPSELAALQAEENAAALEALRKRREKEHKKMMRSKGSNKRVGKSWKNDVGIFLLLTITGLFMIFPIYLAVVNSIKPVQEVFLMPPKLYAMDPTFDNFKDLFKIANNSWVPFSRNICCHFKATHEPWDFPDRRFCTFKVQIPRKCSSEPDRSYRTSL